MYVCTPKVVWKTYDFPYRRRIIIIITRMNEKSLIRPELNLTLTEKNDCNYYHLTIIYSYSCANYLFFLWNYKYNYYY